MCDDFFQPKAFYDSDTKECRRMKDPLLVIPAGQTWTCLSPVVVIVLQSSQSGLLKGQLKAKEK